MSDMERAKVLSDYRRIMSVPILIHITTVIAVYLSILLVTIGTLVTLVLP